MSTQQPAGESSPEPAPSYAQPQDPWAGFEPGVAAVPTDPGRDAVPAGPSNVWNQETLQHGGPYSYVPQQSRNRAGLYVLVICAVLLLGGGGGYSAWYVLSHRKADTPTAQNTTSTPPVVVSTTPTFDPSAVKVDDCIFNRAPATAPKADVITVPCSTKDSYTVLRIVRGASSIPKDPTGKVTREVTYAQLCDKAKPNDPYFYWDDSDDNLDMFMCLKHNS